MNSWFGKRWRKAGGATKICMNMRLSGWDVPLVDVSMALRPTLGETLWLKLASGL
jgi:hypothetical protein